MRIAYVYDFAYPFTKGGGERRIYEVARRLSHRGHQVFILSMKCWGGPASFLDDGLCYRAISRRMIPYHRSGRRSISQAIRFGASAWRMLGHEKYDVIDCGQWPYFHLLSAKAYSLVRRTPFFVTWYEIWKNHWFEYLGKRGALGMLAERVFSRFPDTIVGVCEMTRKELVDIGVGAEHITVIPNGVDIARFQAVPPGPIATDLVYCGRLKNHKNVHLLIETVAILKRSRPDISAVIIGEGPESSALRTLAGRLSVAENIIFAGGLNDFDEVIGWLKASKVFVHPSTKEGGGSTTLLEGNACGLPVIAIKCPRGIDPSLIREGENGYFVESSPERIAEVVLVLLNNPDRLSANSRSAKRMAADYDWDVVATQYEQLYEREISMRRNDIT